MAAFPPVFRAGSPPARFLYSYARALILLFNPIKKIHYIKIRSISIFYAYQPIFCIKKKYP